MLTRRMRALVELTRLPDAAPIDGLVGLERLIADVGAIIGADAAILARSRTIGSSPSRSTESSRSASSRCSSWPLIEPAGRVPALDGGQPLLIAPLGPGAGRRRHARDARQRPVPDGRGVPDPGGRPADGVLFSLFRAPVDELEIDERTLDAIGRVLDISFANRRLREVVAAASAATGRCSSARPTPSSSSAPTASSSTPTRPPAGCTAATSSAATSTSWSWATAAMSTWQRGVRPHGIAELTGASAVASTARPSRRRSTSARSRSAASARILAIVRDLTERTPAPGRARPGPEDGGDRPARRGRRPRAQQPARVDRRVQPAAPDRPEPARRTCAARPTCSSRRRTGRG